MEKLQEAVQLIYDKSNIMRELLKKNLIDGLSFNDALSATKQEFNDRLEKALSFIK